MAHSIRFTPEADADLENLSVFSVERFGLAQAERYRKGITDLMRMLSVFPHLGADASDVRPGLRRHVHGSHVIYYRVRDDALVISRILGPGQDPTREFAD